jgi:hypothetical protein
LITQYKRIGFGEILAISAVALAMGLAIGVTSSAGRFDLAVVMFVAVAGAIAFLRPSIALLGSLAAALLIVGSVQLYAPGLQRAQWAVAAATIILGAMGVLEYVFSPKKQRDMPPGMLVILVFVFLLAASGLINSLSVGQMAFGVKGYVQVLGVFFAITLLRDAERTASIIPGLLVGIAILQLPFVMHQWFVLVPQRMGLGGGIVAEDIVSGTMGASFTGGGSNALLSILLITAIAILASGYRAGAIRLRWVVPGMIICIIPVLLNANRIAMFYLVLVMVMIFGRQLWANPKRSMTGVIAVTAMVLAAVWANANLTGRADEGDGWRELIQTTFERNFEEDFGYGDYDLNRIGSIVFWWQESMKHQRVDKILFGHGPGAAREAGDSALGVTTLAKARYSGVGIGLTAVSALLWELGVVGLVVAFGILLSAYRSANYVIRHLPEDDFRAWVARALKVSVVIFAISFFHKNTFVFHMIYQTLLFTVIGTLSTWHYFLARSQASHHPVAA